MSDLTSLSTSLGAALTFGRKNKIQVVLEYDGDSIRRTGEAVPVEYSHRYSSLDQAKGRGMPLLNCLEAETRIPDETNGPALKRVLLSADRVFGGDLKMIKRLEDAGIDVSTFLGRFPGAPLFLEPDPFLKVGLHGSPRGDHRLWRPPGSCWRSASGRLRPPGRCRCRT